MAESAIELRVAGEPAERARLRVEDVILAILLGAMMLLPVLEIGMRRLLSKGISNAPSLVQHLTLLAGMLGAAIAARDNRLLALGSVERIIPARWRGGARVASRVVTLTITALLFWASVEFVRDERAAAATLAYGIPIWVAELALPLGFALITLRILSSTSPKWMWRGIAAAGAALLVIVFAVVPVEHGTLVIPAFIVLGLATFLGAPIFTVLAGAALILTWNDGSALSTLTISHYQQAINPTLPTVPLFTLAGYFLAEGGASRRLVRLFRALVGNLRGGPAILVAVLCAFFTSFTGASGVTILALGGLLMPVLLSAGYSEKTSLGLLTGTGSLGLLFPPALPLIFYAVIAGVDIRTMFLAGIVPGIMLVMLTAVWGISQAPARPRDHLAAFSVRELRLAAWDAKWELLVPVVALWSLFSGWATPVEAAAVTAVYTFVVETFIYRDLKLVRDVPRVVADSGVLVGGVLLILGVALGFTSFLALAEVPSRGVEWVGGAVHSKAVFLLLVNLFLLVVGMLMDIFSAIVVVVPLLIPLGEHFQIDPVHLGIIFLANLELGYLTPPVGQNLFLSSLRFDKPVAEVFRAVIPMLLVFAIGVLLITYVPAMTTALPAWFSR